MEHCVSYPDTVNNALLLGNYTLQCGHFEASKKCPEYRGVLISGVLYFLIRFGSLLKCPEY